MCRPVSASFHARLPSCESNSRPDRTAGLRTPPGEGLGAAFCADRSSRPLGVLPTSSRRRDIRGHVASYFATARRRLCAELWAGEVAGDGEHHRCDGCRMASANVLAASRRGLDDPLTPASMWACGQSAKGKERIGGQTALEGVRARGPVESDAHRVDRLVCLPITDGREILRDDSIAFEPTCLQTRQAKTRSPQH